MSATIKQFYRGEDLAPTDHRDMFLEIDEGIRIHYRELQLELSVKEFEDFVATLKQQSDKVLDVIQKTNFEDGKSFGVNGEEFRIWAGSQLKHPIAHHPQRVSLEECSDGYHLNYRNYKILLDEKGFGALKRAFASADSEGPVASTFEELAELFEINGIRFEVLDEGEVGTGSRDVHRIAVSEHDASKTRAVMAGIGMEGRLKEDSVIYSKKGLAIELIVNENAQPEAVSAASNPPAANAS